MIQYILTDIEGTTTSISFVHDVLFPYSSAHLPNWVRAHAGEDRVKSALAQVRDTASREMGLENPSMDECIGLLMQWIAEDRKHGALKALQGYIWKEGYTSGAFTSHIYPDVAPALARWKKSGMKMGVYSSGSVDAQILLFGHTSEGDLKPYFSDYFDTAVGHKREVKSYEHICTALGLPAGEILFLSDVPEELDAAKAAGMQTIQLLRPGTAASDRHQTAATFAEILP